MTIRVQFQPDRAYYKEAYEELLSLTKFEKWRPLLAFSICALGIFLFYIQVIDYLPLAFTMFGGFDLYMIYVRKKRWLDQQVSTNITQQTIEFEFTDKGIFNKSGKVTGELRWSDLKGIQSTQKGIVLNQKSGVNTYLPFKFFNSDADIDFLLSKAI